MKRRTKQFVGSRPCFTGAPSVEVGGFNVDATTNNLQVGQIIPEGSIVLVDEGTRSAKILKTGRVKSIDAVDAKKVTLESDGYMAPIFAAGDVVDRVVGGNYSASATISSVEDAEDGYKVVLATELASLAVGDVIFSVVKDSNNKSQVIGGNAVTVSHIEVTNDEVIVDPCKDTMQYSMYERRVPAIPTFMKSADGQYVKDTHIRLTKMK